MKAGRKNAEGRPAHSVQILRGPTVCWGLTTPRLLADKALTLRELDI